LFEEAKQELRAYEFLKEYISDRSMILDLGCGHGGRTMFYASLFKCKVIGYDIDERALDVASRFASKNFSQLMVEFVTGSAGIPLDDGCIDAIMTNDVFEHLENPSLTLADCFRVLKNKGFLYISFNPYWSGAGHHLNDWIPVPWIHLILSERTLIRILRWRSRSDKYITFQFPNISSSSRLDSFNELGAAKLNYLSLRSFRKLLSRSNFRVIHFGLEGYGDRFSIKPLRWFMDTLKNLPILRELFCGRIICVLQKDCKESEL
jgi:ubiquinone/menaquinone biosynthesis C-methylase UbiE